MNMKKLAPYMVLLAGILWGIIGLFVRRFQTMGLGSMEIVCIRAITTTILLFLFLFIYDRKMLRIRIKDIWCFVGTGIFSIVFFNFCYFKAMTLTSLSVAAVLLYTAPAIVMVLSVILFKEKITVVKIVAFLLTFVGCVFVTGLLGGGNVLNAEGILMGLGAGLGYALYSIFSRYALERGYHSLTISFYTFLLAMVGTFPLCDGRVMWESCAKDASTGMFCIVYGMVSTVIPYIVYTRGLKEMENSKASILASIEPVAATLMGVLVFHEKLTINGIVGTALVLGAIVICNLYTKE